MRIEAHWQTRTPSSPAPKLTPLGEVDGLLVGLDGDGVGLLLGEAAADGASLLVAEVEGDVLRLLVELAEVLALLLVDNGENASDRLANGVAVGSAACSNNPAGRVLCPQSFAPSFTALLPFTCSLALDHPTSDRAHDTTTNAHLGELARRATDNLLDAKGGELSAELGELSKEVGLVLGGKLRSPDFLGGRHFSASQRCAARIPPSPPPSSVSSSLAQ